MKRYLINLVIWLAIYLAFAFIYDFAFKIYNSGSLYINEYLLFLVPSIALVLLRFKNDTDLPGLTAIVLTCILISSIATKTDYAYSFSYLLLLSGITYAVLSKLLILPALDLYKIKNRYKLYTLSVFITSALNIIFKTL
jgi:hypothetical protein